MKRMIRSNNGIVFLVESEGKPIGYPTVLIQKNIPIFKLEKYGEILDMYVKKEFRGRGVSKELKDKRLLWLKSKNIQKVTLKVLAKNFNAKKYIKNGVLMIF